jgi:hypothetical protein
LHGSGSDSLFHLAALMCLLEIPPVDLADSYSVARALRAASSKSRSEG